LNRPNIFPLFWQTETKPSKKGTVYKRKTVYLYGIGQQIKKVEENFTFSRKKEIFLLSLQSIKPILYAQT